MISDNKLSYLVMDCMVAGVPFICIRIYGTFNWAMVENIPSSRVPPEISLIMSAPFSIAISATFDLNVSTDIGMEGNSFRIHFRALHILFVSSSVLTSGAPGRVEYPPMSKMQAPSLMAFSAVNRISCCVIDLHDI